MKQVEDIAPEEEKLELVSDKEEKSFYVEDIDVATDLDQLFGTTTSTSVSASGLSSATSATLVAPAKPAANAPTMPLTPAAKTTKSPSPAPPAKRETAWRAVNAVASPEANLSLPDSAVPDITARTQIFLEANGGDYSRYARVYPNVAVDEIPTVVSLGTAKAAELYLSRLPQASLSSRNTALRIVRQLTDKMTPVLPRL